MVGARDTIVMSVAVSDFPKLARRKVWNSRECAHPYCCFHLLHLVFLIDSIYKLNARFSTHPLPDYRLVWSSKDGAQGRNRNFLLANITIWRVKSQNR